MLATICAYTLLILSIVGFLLAVFDRNMARLGKKRLPEAVHLTVACCLGAIGTTLGFFLAKHKVFSMELRLAVPAIAVGEVVLLFWMVPGFWQAMVHIFTGA